MQKNYVNNRDFSIINDFQNYEEENNLENLRAKITENKIIENISTKQPTKAKDRKKKQSKTTKESKVNKIV